MDKGVKIVYRKTIKDVNQLKGFEELSGNTLPEHTSFLNTRTWQFDLSREAGRKALEELILLFELPSIEIDVDKLFCKMIVRREADVLFEAHKWDEVYQTMSDMGRI
jgi:hypothetical protein